MTEDLTPRQGKAADLEDQFKEIITELIFQIISLERIPVEANVSASPVSESTGVYDPEIDKTVMRLLDAVSNTVIMDAH